jgi:hypothetical protein
VNVRIVPLTAAGTYLTGNEVRFNVVFDEEVTLERSFDFAVNSGGTASCSSLSSSKEVLCSYTVSTGESSFDLDINSNTSFLDLDVVKATSDNMFLNFIPPRDHSSGALNEIGTYIVDGLDLNITSLEFASSDGSYGIGDQVLLDVHFNYDVSLTAGVVPSKFLLNTAPTQQEAIFSTIVDTNTIRYAYTVLLTDTSASLAVLSGGIFSIEGDVFSNTHGRAVTPDFSLSSTAINGSISVDGVRPLLTNITISEADGSYGLGDVINFELSFDESVRVDTTSGTPSIELETGVTDRFAVFTSGSSSSTLGFQYTVQAGDSSSDLSHKAVSSLVLNSGSLTDLAGNSLLSLDLPGPAALLASRSVVIDSVAPSISSVSFLTADGTYNIGDKVYAEVTFTENVDVNFTSGTPSLELETGTIDRTAVYTSGTGTAKLTFEYTVVTGDSSNDLDYKNTTSLNLNGGVITDGAGNNSDLTLPAVGTLSGSHNIIIDASTPTLSSLRFLSANGSYGVSSTVSMELVFDESVYVSGGGNPQLELETGTTDQFAVYSSGSGTTSLTFNYIVQTGDTSADLDYKAISSLSLNGGLIADNAGNAADLTLSAVGTLASAHNIVIDGIIPSVTNISLLESDGSYGASNSISFVLSFSKNIDVDITGGTPSIELETGVVDRSAVYSSGTGTSSLTFLYSILAGDTSSDLDYKTTNSLSLNGGTLRDSALNNSQTSLLPVGTLASNHGIVIDTTAPTLSSIQISTVDGQYGASETITFHLNFSEEIIVDTTSGIPQLELETGTVDKFATYSSGSGTSSLTFNYVVESGDSSSDLDYKATTSLSENGGYLKDAAQNSAVLTLPAVGVLAAAESIVIDAISPTISSLQILTADGTYGTSSTISFEIGFSEIVNINSTSGTPSLELETGLVDEQAIYTSGSGTSLLTFQYTVQNGNSSSDLDYKTTTSLNLNSGLIRDGASNNAVLTLPAVGTLAAAEAVVIDASDPFINSIQVLTPDGSYGVSSSISFELQFNESVFVSTSGGSPRLELETGTTDQFATFSSGSGTSNLTFEYIVNSGDLSGDLDYKATTSLEVNGGSIRDSSSNNAVLTLPAVGTLAAAEAVIIDGVSPNLSSVSITTSDGSYGVSQSISFELSFDESVYVSTAGGTPQLELETGVTDRVAIYTSGSGSSILTFEYIVQAGDISLDLDYKSINSLISNGGSIQDLSSNNAVLTLPAVGTLASVEAVVIDAAPPSLSSLLIATADGSYGVGQSINLELTFTESVFVSLGGGTPALELETGVTDRFATYTSGSGSNILTFSYTVQAGDSTLDLDYKATTSLGLSGSTIRDQALNNAVLTLPAVGTLAASEAIVVDGIAPDVDSLLISTVNGSYGVSQSISFEITFSESIFVSGTPQLELETGSTDRFANYTSGSGSSVLTFEYIVNSGDSSSDLDYKATTSLTENGGSIRDAASNDSVLTLPAVGTLAAAEAIVIDAAAPSVSSLLIATADGSYGVSQTINFELTFNESVFVSGTPQLELETGATDRFANYTSGSGSSVLTFEYIVNSGDSSNDLDYKATTSLTENSGSIRDAASNDAVLILPAVGTLAAAEAIVIDGSPPNVSSILIATADGSYGVSQTINFELTFNESVFVSGTPQLELETGATDRFANYTSGSGSSVLTFEYIVNSGDTSNDLDYKAATSLTENSGSIRDLASNDADLTLPVVGTLAASEAVIIDTTSPQVSAILISTADGSYGTSQTISFEITFDESVFVSSSGGTPSLELETGVTDRFANYTSGSGSNTLTFEYIVANGDVSTDLDYKATSSLTTNGGSLQDASLNDSVLTLPAVGTLAAAEDIVIDTTTPNISSIRFINSDGNYKIGDEILLEVNFSKVVTVNLAGGTPDIELETGTVDRKAIYASGTSSNNLTFKYTVLAGDLNSDLDYKSTGGLVLNGGTIKDSLSRDAILTLPAVGTLATASAINIDGVVPNLNSLEITTIDGIYGISQSISFELTFNESVIVSGTPQLELETGATDRFANYTSGSGSSVLTFEYIVNSGDSSNDLDYKATTSLTENNGSIRDAASNDAVLTLPAVGTLAAAEAIVIDGSPPNVSSILIATADGNYGVSQTISFELTFNESVFVSGTPQLELETGATDRFANYTSGSGSSVLTFEYIVNSGDSSSDLDYKATTSLTENGGSIRDAASNDSVLTLPAVGTLAAAEAIVIDAAAPSVSSLLIATADGSYGVSQTINFELTFNESVFVSGTPQLELETGATDRFANYTSGSGSSVLTFEYIVNSGDSSNDLDYKATTSLTENNGSIRDAASNDAVLTLPAVGTLAAAEAIVIDGSPPNVSSILIATADGNYGVSQTISFELTFNESVFVSGTPQLELETGATDRFANYTSGSGSSVLTFEYIVNSGDSSSDLDYKATTSLTENGGSIRDAASNDSVLTLPAVGTLAAAEAIVIDAAAPSVSSLLIATADGSYGVSQTINFELTFNESVFVSGTPQLELETGATDRFANYTSGSGSSVLTFEYIVNSGDSSNDLDYKATTSLTENNGSIRDAASNDAVLTLPAVGTLAAAEAIVIDGSPPNVSSILIATADGNYGVSQTISFELTFNESVFVSGTPQLELETGATDRFANYTSGSGSSVLTFEYIVNSGDSSSDLDYKATTSLTENGGSIRDAASNDSVLTLPAVGTLAAAEAIVIDAAAPSVSSLLIATADGSYGVSQTINFELTFNESVFVSGTPQLELETGATDRFANYTSGSGSSVLTFEYIVNSGDSSNDLDYKATTSLTENSGSIRDAASNDAVLILPAVGTLAAAEAIVIDGSPPNVSSILIATADGSYGVSQSISFELTFNESVFVSGTPQLELETGATDRFANYTSGSGSSILTFEYTVVAGDTSSDLDYTSTTSLGLNGGSIKDAAMNDSVLDLPGLGTLAAVEAIVVDTTSPTISSLLIATNDGSYGVSSTISFELTFNESVFVSSAGGTPQLELETGTTDRFATYTSGSGSTVLTFQYTIEAGDSSADLDYKATTSLNSNGGSIRDLASNDSDLTLPAVGTLASSEAINIDGNLPNVSAIQILTSDGSYGVSSTISLELTFNESVFVSSAGGTPSIELETGATDKFATYTSGSGTTKLTFEYLVETGDSSLDLDYKTTTSFVLNGGSITDAASNSADLNLPVVGTLAAAEAVIVDGVQANIGSISFLTGDATYGTSASITLELDFDEVVVVSGTPSLTLETGGVDRLANFTTGSGTDKLTFEYIVNLGDTSSDLDYSSTGALSLNTGSINDEAGNSAILTLPAVGTLAAASAIVINTVTPFTFDIDFTTDSDYTVTSGSISFSGTTADLLANDQVDDADDATGFAGGTKDNVEWNGGNSGVSVSASTFNKGTNEKFLTYDSLVLYANLDEANKVDSSTITSTIGANGTLNTGDGGTNKNSTGIVNNAISFDGVDDYINFGNPAELKFEPKNDSFTAIAWIKVANGNSGVVLSRRVGTNLNYIVEVDGSGYLRCASGTASVLNTDIRVDDGAWHQVGIINDSSGTGTYGCIIDGKYYRWIRDNSIASPVTVEFLVGARNNASSGTYTDFFQGDVDEVQVWNRKLSIAEVNSMFEIKNDIVKAGHFYSRIIDAGSSQSWTTLKWRTSEPIGKDLLHSNQSEDVSSTEYGSDSITGLMTDNVLLTPFDDNTSYVGTANEVSDKSTSSNDGSASGNILVFKNLESRKGNALHIGPGFSNPKKYIDYSSPANMNWQPDTDEFTLSVWFSTIPSMNGTLFSKRAGTLEQYQVFLLSGQIGVYSGGVLYYTGAYITDNHWHHVSLRNFDDAGVKKFQVYLDGNQVGATQTSGSEMAPNAGVLLGARVQNNDGSGITFDIKPAYFEEFSAWDRALSATEILHLYKRGKNNLKFQIRSCDDDACDTEVFVGPDGTNKTYFSESSNKNGSGIPNTGAPSVDISSAVSANRYFQYRFLMETNAINSTFLNKVEVLPAQFNASNPTIFNLTSIPYQTLTSSEFVVTKSCTGTIKYQLSNDGSNWFYFNAGTWTAATDSYTDANTETEVSTSIDKFPSQVGTGNLKVKAFLNSDGSTSCTIDNIRIKGGKI